MAPHYIPDYRVSSPKGAVIEILVPHLSAPPPQDHFTIPPLDAIASSGPLFRAKCST